MSQSSKEKELCLNLIGADSEARVIEILTASGLWQNSHFWHPLGDEEFNFSTVGSQQSQAEQAIIEKLVNSIDARMMLEARLQKLLPNVGSEPQAPGTPQSVSEARQKFFGSKLNQLEQLSLDITVAATGSRDRPCFTIVDRGEGQSPRLMPKTILSLHKGNKDKIKFAQGKFNMGGTGVLEFCGRDRNLQLVVSRRHPELVDINAGDPTDANWSFTIIRREDPTAGRSSKYTYLAPLPGHGLLNFSSFDLAIFPKGNLAYAAPSTWGTLIKLYEYDARGFKTNMMLSGGLLGRAGILLPEPALPIHFHECRDFRGKAGSFSTPMYGLIERLRRDIDSETRSAVEWHDKREITVDGEKFSVRLYLFESKDKADTYRKDEGIVFTYNGQAHATLTKDFFRRKRVKQDYLWHSLLMFVDCSEISTRAHERLFMNSRDRLRGGELKAKLEEEIEEFVRDHDELKRLASERRKKEISTQSKMSESMVKVIENLLSKNPTLAELLGQGLRVKNPHKPDTAASGPSGYIGRRFPSYFRFKGLEHGVELKRAANIGSRVRISFETDAANDYFKRDDQPGQCELFIKIENAWQTAADYQSPRLLDGFAHLSLSLPEAVISGQTVQFEFRVNDPSRAEPFSNYFELEIFPEREPSEKGEPGKRTRKSDAPGEKDGPNNNEGSNQSDARLDIPEPSEVTEKDWANQTPTFDKFTALRIKESPDSTDQAPRYDYFLNIDNVHLQTYMKAKPKEAESLKLKFSVGLTLIALSLLHKGQTDKPTDSDSPERIPSNLNIKDAIAFQTSAIAPFLLPMIESVSQLIVPEEELSDSAGEAA